MLLTFFLTQSVLLAYNTAKRTVELWLINTTTLCRNNKLTNAQSVGNTFLIFSRHNTVTNKSLKKKIVNWFSVYNSNKKEEWACWDTTSVKKKYLHLRWAYDAFPIFNALLGLIRLFPLPTGGDPEVSKAEHAELSKNVQEMKKNLSSLENSVSDTALQ